MPHKRNPVVSERVSGLARVLRGYAQVAFEDMPLWHERDISHSSAERVILPDATGLLHFMLSDMTWVMEGLQVDPERMRANLEADGGLFFSQKVLTSLVDRGMARDDAYGAVQRAATDAWDRGIGFRERMWEEVASAGVLSEEEFAALFHVEPYLSNLGGVFERLGKLPVEEV
jgi:adenylosuccinate lyase